MPTKGKLLNPADVGSDVILVVGQSNAAGYGQGLDATYFDVPNHRIQQYAGLSGGAYAGQAVAAVEPLFHHKQAPDATRIGHAMTFAREWVKQVPHNRSALIVPAAHGDTGFTTTSVSPAPTGYHVNAANDAGCWDPAATDGGVNLAAYAVAQTNAALALNPNNRLVAILWHQGEADGGFMTQAQYAAALDRLIAYLRANITGAASTPFILGQMVPSYVALTTQIGLAHVDTPRRNQRCAFVYGPTSTSLVNATEAYHYNAAGQRILGQSYWAALPLARANVLGSLPLAPTGVTLTQAGTTVNVTWVRPLSRVTDYQVQTNTGSGWSTLTRTQSIDVSATVTGLSNGQTVQVRVAGVNESGTGPNSSTASLTLAGAPGQVTGLTAGTPTGNSVPLSWTAASGATSYTVQYRVTGAGSWSTFGSVTGTTATVTGLTGGTGYDFQVAAVNGGGTGTYSTTTTATTSAAAGIIDTVGVSAHKAFGLRKLRTAYAGSAVNVRRSSDSTTQNIGFTAAGDLDTAALLAFAGAGSAYVATWYDQSGNGRDMAQATAANQPQIVNAGAVVTAGGKPAVVFNGTTTLLTSAVAGVCDLGAATPAVVATAGTQATQALYSESGTANDARYYVYAQAAGSYSLMVKDSTAAVLVDAIKSATATTQHAVAFADTGSGVTTYIDATSSPYVYSRAGKTITLTQSTIGARRDVASSASSWWGGSMSELVFFAAALSSGQVATTQAAQKAYYGTP